MNLTDQGMESIRAALQAFFDLEASMSERVGQSQINALRVALEPDWGAIAALEEVQR